MIERIECPKCTGRMETGFIIDEIHGGTQVSQWVEGLPNRHWFLGMRTKGRRKLPITVYRCSRCGFLESWATGLA